MAATQRPHADLKSSPGTAVLLLYMTKKRSKNTAGRWDLNPRPLDPQDGGVGVFAAQPGYAGIAGCSITCGLSGRVRVVWSPNGSQPGGTYWRASERGCPAVKRVCASCERSLFRGNDGRIIHAPPTFRSRATAWTCRVSPRTTAVCSRWRLPGDGLNGAGDGPRLVRAGCACPVVSGRSVRRGSGVKRDFACTFTRHFHLCSLPGGHGHA